MSAASSPETNEETKQKLCAVDAQTLILNAQGFILDLRVMAGTLGRSDVVTNKDSYHWEVSEKLLDVQQHLPPGFLEKLRLFLSKYLLRRQYFFIICDRFVSARTRGERETAHKGLVASLEWMLDPEGDKLNLAGFEKFVKEQIDIWPAHSQNTQTIWDNVHGLAYSTWRALRMVRDGIGVL